MKKIIILAAIIFTAAAAKAQTYFNNARADYDLDYESHFGIEVSGNLAGATSGTDFATANIKGFTAGIRLDLPAGNIIGIMPGLAFTQKGFSAYTPMGSYTQRTQSIDLPVLVKFKTGSFLNFVVGPQLSYLISNKNEFSQNFEQYARPAYEFTGLNLRFQAVTGLGLTLTKKIGLHARYAIDLSSTPKNGNRLTPEYRMKTWQFGVGVNI